MVRKPQAKPDPDQPGVFLPNGAAAKTGLNRSTLDTGWGVFLRLLAHKAESAGRRVIAVGLRNSSPTCPCCGHCAESNRDREHFCCTACGYLDHAPRIDDGAVRGMPRAGPGRHSLVTMGDH
ncbi:zinc ribbon domain-containing protein [Longimycelium tulufanense]|uniref:zinc ribbon domain-containing protein n=1 Tax=Longimycelium tulufanense TaxID=907463 RepID=UPI003570AAA6